MACGIATVMGSEMVFVSSEYPWQARMDGLLRAADVDDNFLEGLEIYNELGSDDPYEVMGALQDYNDLTQRAWYDPDARVISGVVREAARIKDAADRQSDPDYQPTIEMGFSLRRLKPPKSIRKAVTKGVKAAAKLSRNPALVPVAAMIPGVGPGLAAGIGTYQTAMFAVDAAKKGDALAAMNIVAEEAAKGNPQAEQALTNIRKGAAIVNDLQKMEVPSAKAVQSMIASRAGVEVEKVASSMGLPTTAVTSTAISKLAEGKLPTLSQVVPGLPGAPKPPGITVLPQVPTPATPKPAAVPAPRAAIPPAPKPAAVPFSPAPAPLPFFAPPPPPPPPRPIGPLAPEPLPPPPVDDVPSPALLAQVCPHCHRMVAPAPAAAAAPAASRLLPAIRTRRRVSAFPWG